MNTSVVTPSLKKSSIADAIRRVAALLQEWRRWEQEVACIVDQPYDRQTHTEVFADGEEMMSRHETLQAKTLAYLDQAIEHHGFLAGLDGSHIDRKDLRLRHRVKHRIEELKVLHASLRGISMNTNAESKPACDESPWSQITREYGETKRAFGRKIGFVGDPYKRSVIFRDTEQAFALANLGFSKPAVILAGGVIEELIRLYLHHKGETNPGHTFDDYIRTCAAKGLLKAAIRHISNSAREFRNIVHLEKESSKRYTISKATARAAVSSILMVVNDFEPP